MKHLFSKTGIILAASLVTLVSLSAITKHETDIFGKWLAWQQVYDDRSIADLKNSLDDQFVALFKSHYEKSVVQLRGLAPVLAAISNNNIQPGKFQIQAPLDEQMKDTLAFLYDALDNNQIAFVDYLINNGMADAKINWEDQNVHYDNTIEKYKAFGRILFPQNDTFKENEYLLAVANRLFEYEFSDATTEHFQKLLTSYELYPVARFISAFVWFHLVGEGWKHWHSNMLNSLVQEAARGKEIVYIAGGTDFYHLLRQGIYNITVIDPFLPTQARFYSEGWNFLISDEALGSEIRFGPSCNSIKMHCEGYVKGEQFYSKMSNNQILSLRRGIITWNVYDRNNNKIGHVIIHRRPAMQEDFIYDDTKAFAISYDEMTFVAIPDMLNGWGIDPTMLSPDFKMYVKQLRSPITKNTLCNIRVSAMLNMADLRFINLGSDPT